MKYEPTLAAAASGKLGGMVFSHNAGGQYVRAYVIPTNPGTPQQEVIRVATAQLTTLWLNSLTQAQRDNWEAYAAAVPITDNTGNPRFIKGLPMYVRSNVSRIQEGLPRNDDGPTILNLGEYTIPTFDAPDASADTVDVNFTVGDDWVGEDDSAMLIYASRGQNATINYFKGPYRLAGAILGDATTPPTSPATITLPFAVVAGQRVFFRARVTRADGRLSTDFRNFGTAA